MAALQGEFCSGGGAGREWVEEEEGEKGTNELNVFENELAFF